MAGLEGSGGTTPSDVLPGPSPTGRAVTRFRRTQCECACLLLLWRCAVRSYSWRRIGEWGRDPTLTVVNETARLLRARGVRFGFGFLAFAAVTVVTKLIARYHSFMGFAKYDDEGYLLISLKSFLNHGALYDDVFTQYGPFYYEFWGGVFSIFGIPVNHHGGRTMIMVVWVLSSLLIGLSTWRMTGS